MRRTLSILFCLTALLLTGSCSRRQLDDYPDSQLTVRVFIPAERVTRSEIGETGSQQEEKAIKRLQIWVFRHSDGSLIGYLDPPVGNLQSGTVQTYSMFLSDAIANAKPHVDVYAIANSGSTGLTLDANTGRSVLDAAAMSGSAFGVGSPVTSVPQEGLPFAGVSKNLEMTGSYPVLEVETVTITRAVSKVQILLCRQPGEITDAFILEGIHLSGQIGASERLFTNATYSGHTFGTKLFDIIGGSYETLSYDFPVPETIPACDNPGEFIFRSTGHEAETPHEYGRRLDAAIATGTLLSPGRLYLRETDKQLSGSISYRTVAGGPLKLLNFTMNAAGDFTRNHTWIIYAYFLGGKLYVQPTILPWNAGHARFSHSTQGRSTLEYSNYLRYDKDRMTNTWGTPTCPSRMATLPAYRSTHPCLRSDREHQQLPLAGGQRKFPVRHQVRRDLHASRTVGHHRGSVRRTGHPILSGSGLVEYPDGSRCQSGADGTFSGRIPPFQLPVQPSPAGMGN